MTSQNVELTTEPTHAMQRGYSSGVIFRRIGKGYPKSHVYCYWQYK